MSKTVSNVVVCNVRRADQAVIDSLARSGVATVHEAMGRLNLMKPDMRPIWPGAQIAGSAITILAQPGDNWMLHVAIEQCRPGDVLLVTCTADNTDGMFGELLATSARAHGAIALVIEAGCRDVKLLHEIGFPVWSRAISARGTVKVTLGAVNIPVVCAGVAVSAGDVVVADDDGVVIVPRGQAADIAAKARQREVREDDTRQRLASGQLGLDIYGLGDALTKAGLGYVDELEE
jgi:4-hydroxy-4-methyl-2-oxoglutarate aldolase